MTISMTPVQQMEWLEDDVIVPAMEGRLAGWSVDELDTEENVYLSQEAIAELASNLTPEEKLIRLRGGYTETTKVFPEFKGSYPNVIPHDAFMDDLSRDDRWAMYEAMDYGYSNPTAWVFVAVHPDGRIIAFDELYSARVTVPEWVGLIFAKRAEISARIGRPWQPQNIAGDPMIGRDGEYAAATGISIQQDYAMRGIPINTGGIVSARTNNQNVGLEKYHMYFRRRTVGGEEIPWFQLTEKCIHGIHELRTARLPHQTLTQKAKANPKEQIRDKDNHWIDAVKYLLIMTHDLRPQEVQEEEFKLTQHEGIREAIGYRPQRSIPIAESDYYDTISHDTFDRQELY
jgi:hypothetical protein